MDWNKELYNIRYCKLNFTLRMMEDCVLPLNKPSAIRGGIGEMLLRANCIRNRECDKCDFFSECIVQRTMYSQFEHKPSFLNGKDSVGYVIECENYMENFKQGDVLEFTLVLFGKTIVYFNQYLQAVYALGCNGLGKNNSKFMIESVKNTRNENILYGNNVEMKYYKVENLADYIEFRLKQLISGRKNELVFKTPLTQKYENAFLNEFNMTAIIKSVKRRLYILDCYENNHVNEAEQYYLEDIEEIPQIITQNVRPISVRRYSSRQDAGMNLNGIKGEIFVTEIADELLPILIAGEVMHIGKNTSFGFGKYVLR